MRRVDGPGFDAKTFVARGYDRCGATYTAAREQAPPDWLNLMCDRLPDSAPILDIGCGGGIPIAAALAKRFAVTGVDISLGQIERARSIVPAARFLHGDIMKQIFAPGTFAGVTMIYALFHLPREEHLELLKRVHLWLRPGGLLLSTLARQSEAGYIEDDFCGAGMYWSHFAEAEYDHILKRAGFDLLEKVQIGHGYASTACDDESHPLVLALKPS
jgi:SAM-dependent methyltransferase